MIKIKLGEKKVKNFGYSISDHNGKVLKAGGNKKAIRKVLDKMSTKEKNKKNYNDRNRSWDTKNRYYGSGVGGNSI